MTDDNNHSGIHWGHVLAGAAVTAGVMAAFVVDPSVGQQVVDGAKDIASGIYAAVGNAGSWVGDVLTSGVNAASNNVPLAVGTAATAGALIASTGYRKPVRIEADHTTREELRRMQALILERMQETGYAPAGQTRC